MRKIYVSFAAEISLPPALFSHAFRHVRFCASAIDSLKSAMPSANSRYINL